ncbi:MAG: LytR/AlgR family response regulator transcription factor [Candidatus Cryptobacteroides sp.]
MNKKLPKYLLGKFELLGTVTFSVLFAIVFFNIYLPFSQTAWFDLNDAKTFEITLAFFLASVLILSFSRVLMYKLKDKMDYSYLGYILWCAAEIVLICLLYTLITDKITMPGVEKASEVFGRALIFCSISLAIPELIAAMYFAINDKNNTIRLLNYDSVVTDEPIDPVRMQKISLYDNSGALKFSVSPQNLFYIESDDNYIKAWYTDGKGELKQYMVRCRLKTIEETFRGSSLMRCHRKYIVNLKKVKVLRKESDGYYLELDNEAIPIIPITKTYSDSVLKYFSQEQKL